MTIDDFINKTKVNPLGYIRYCEILIIPNGDIIECSPCHTESAIEYAINKDGITREELSNTIPDSCLPLEYIVDKYGLVAIWYCGYMYSKTYGINDKQRETINKLEENVLIQRDDKYIQEATEYYWETNVFPKS